MNTFWVTFYSYKGGVGRTMSLTNVAALLAKKGRRVLLIDFDLEAPGLDSFEGLGCAKACPGVVEYVTKYLDTGKAPNIEDYVQECTPERRHLRGKLWLMPSGKKDAQYNRERAKINWTDLYEKYDGEQFVENWKAAIESIYKPDYVFIDSRTGLTDVGGICTLHFPQLVVLLYSLNNQNINGIAGVARAISNPANIKSPQLLTVATPVPSMIREKTGLLQERIQLAEKELGVKPHCQIHYDPIISLKEDILVWKAADSRPTWEYDKLREKITEYDVAGFDYLLKELERAVTDLDDERVREMRTALLREYGDRAETFYMLAKASRSFGALDDIEENLRKALEIDPYYSEAFTEFIAFLRAKKRIKEAIKICQSRIANLKHDINSPEVKETLEQLGEIGMSIGEYQIAAEAFKKLIEANTTNQESDEGDEDDAQLLAHLFNYAEARRRGGLLVSEKEYHKMVRIYERGAATEGSGSVINRLNHQQAMYIPYAMLGDTEQAMNLLVSCARLAASVSPRDRIFSVTNYTNIPLSSWLNENGNMIDALREGKLWDGTLLPPSQ